MKSKVLLIDDSVTIHRVIDLSIDFDRYDIVKVFSKEDAALKLQSEQFDYILLDNKLDNIIISEYISELKQQQKSAIIILLVGAFDRFDETDLEKTKADDYLVKPFDSQSLNEKLSSDVDMMPAGIVERIAEADFARDNDDFIQKSSAVAQEAGEVITKEEYLENLEEVQLDDLTDKGYVEDLDQTEQSAKTIEENKVEESAVEQPLVIDDVPTAVPATEPLDEAIIEAPVTDDSTLTAVNNMVSLNDLEEDEDNEDDGSHIAEDDDLPISSIDLDEPLNISKSNDLLENQQNDEEEVALPVIDTQDDEPADTQLNIDFGTGEETPVVENKVEMGEENEDMPLAVQPVSEEDMVPSIELPADNMSDETGSDDSIEMPDPIAAVHSPILPDIDDASTISDDYLMQENLAPADNNGEDMLQEFPDFPDIDDTSTDEMQDLLETAPATEENTEENIEIPNIDFGTDDEAVEPVNIEMPVAEDAPADDLIAVQEESAEQPVDLGGDMFGEVNTEPAVDNGDDLITPVEEPSEEKPLFEDDDWLSDAPIQAEDTVSTDKLDDMPLISTDEAESETEVETNDLDFGNSENSEEDNQISFDMPSAEESEDEPLVMPDLAPVSEETSQEESQPLDFDFGETEAEEKQSEEVDPESIGACASIDTMSFFPEEDSENAKEDISIQDENIVEENTTIEAAEEESPVFAVEENTALEEESISPVTFDETAPETEEHGQEVSAGFDNQEENTTAEIEEPVANNISIEPEDAMPVAPVINTVEESTPVKEAQEYKEDTTGRFGGITVTISRDEIMSMLGNAIDKYFLEEAVKEVIAANMKDIVRNIVPAIAEKYIKEEIERLKNDE